MAAANDVIVNLSVILMTGPVRTARGGIFYFFSCLIAMGGSGQQTKTLESDIFLEGRPAYGFFPYAFASIVYFQNVACFNFPPSVRVCVFLWVTAACGGPCSENSAAFFTSPWRPRLTTSGPHKVIRARIRAYY